MATRAGNLLAMRIAAWLAEIAVAAAIVVASRPAIADPPTAPADPQADKPDKPDPRIEEADQLFAEAKALMPSNLNEACKKFDRSLQLNRDAIGTLLNVALCDEKLGRIASAVARFTEARDRAREGGLPEHQRAAESHLVVLEPQVPHLAVQLTQPLPETKVLVDDRLYALAALANIAIDPGEHVVVVSAPDRLPHRATFVIKPAERKAIVVPPLARAVTVASARRRFGQIATVTGGVAFGTSIGLAFYGLHLHNQQFDQRNCSHRDNLQDGCNTTGQSNNERARTYGTVATVVGGLGLAVGAAGAVLWYLAPGSPQGADASPRVVLDVTGDRVGVVALGRF